MSSKPEYIDYYNLEGELLGTDERKKVLKRQENQSRETGDTDIVVGSVMLLLFDTSGQVYISQRSADKPENPNLWDKSMGGHIVSGDSSDETVKKELDEELGIEASIITDDIVLSEEIKNPITLTQRAIIKKVKELKNYQSKRMTQDGDIWNKRMNVGLYIGIYNGDVKFKDGEVQNLRLIPITELEQEIQKNPDIFTDDILRLIREHAIVDVIMGYARKIWSIVNLAK